MPTAVEGGGQPNTNNLKRVFFGNGALTKGEAVSVVMGTVPNGNLLGPAEAAADAFDSVGHDGFPISRAAQDNASFHLAAGHGFSHRPDKIRIITRGFGFGSDIAYGVTIGEQHGLDLFLVGKTCVVGSDGDDEFFHGM